MSWRILGTTVIETSFINSHVFPLYKKQCSLQPFYIHTIAICISLSSDGFSVCFPTTRINHQGNSRVLWGRNIRDLVHNWRFNYPYEVSWIWINILCSSNSCFFHFAKQMISEFWPASCAIWMLNVNLKLLLFLNILYFLLQVCGSIILGVSIWIRVSKDAQQVNTCSHTRTLWNVEATAYTFISHRHFRKFAMFLLRWFVLVKSNAVYDV